MPTFQRSRKPTKAQMKRLIVAIQRKTFSLYTYGFDEKGTIVTSKDIEAIERLTVKWMKRLG